jgi:hypothetical protein
MTRQLQPPPSVPDITETGERVIYLTSSEKPFQGVRLPKDGRVAVVKGQPVGPTKRNKLQLS